LFLSLDVYFDFDILNMNFNLPTNSNMEYIMIHSNTVFSNCNMRWMRTSSNEVHEVGTMKYVLSSACNNNTIVIGDMMMCTSI